MGTELDAVEVGESGNFKTVVSGEPIEVRPIYGAPFTMTSGCKLWFLANSLPRFKHGTEAELRRTRFIRFDYKPAVKDVTLKAQLLYELDGVFRWMLQGLRGLLQISEIPLGSQNSREVHARFRVSNDPVGSFVQERCVVAVDARERKEYLAQAFSDYCQTYGIPADYQDWFFRRLYERFPALTESQPKIGAERVRVVRGMALKTRLGL